MDWHPQRLTLDVPERDVDPADRMRDDPAMPKLETTGKQRLPNRPDVECVLPDNDGCEPVYKCCNRPWRNRAALSPADNPFRGFDAHEHVALQDDEAFHRCNFHRITNPPLTSSSAPLT